MKNSSDFPNLRYIVDGHYYPVCILGGDRFLDWFKITPNHQLTTDYTFEMMQLSYKYGIRGFDISCRFNLIEAFKRLKKNYPEAIGIGNPNWLCGYKFKNIHLWDIRDRVVLTIIKKLVREDKSVKKILSEIPEAYRLERFLTKKDIKPLSDDEIQQIYIDQDIWFDKINSLRGVVDFCAIGSDYGEWMCALNRLDLIRWQIKTVRNNGMIPISLSHWASITIPLFDKEDFMAHWIYANQAWMYINPELAVASIQTATKPITAFKILSNIKLPDEIKPIIFRLKNFGVKSFIIGLENSEHVKNTIPRVMEALISSK